MSRHPDFKPKSNARLLTILLAALATSICLTIAAVPLYNLFCKHFGIAQPRVLVGQSNEVRGATTHGEQSSRIITVRFTANTASDAPVAFAPLTYTMKVRLGQPVLTAFSAKNLAPTAFDGVAVHMLYALGGEPGVDVANYVDLQQCFCFAQEHYPPNASLRLPLSFTITPNLPAGIHTITFSYTLFKALPNDPRIKVTPSNAGA